MTLEASVFDPGTLDVISYLWTVELNGELYAVSSTSTVSFTPSAAGNYLVRLVVRDDDGASTSRSAVVRVPGGLLAGDTNGDGIVDLMDLNNVRNNFGGTGLGDTNGDGVVDLEDLNAVRNYFGASFPAPIAEASKSTQRRGVTDEPLLDRSAVDAVFGHLAANVDLTQSLSSLPGRRTAGRRNVIRSSA